MSISDDAMSFRDGPHKYRRNDRGRRTYRNGIGWEIRHCTPTGALTGAPPRKTNLWRYDLYSSSGEFVASEPSFWEASRTFSAAYVGGGGQHDHEGR